MCDETKSHQKDDMYNLVHKRNISPEIVLFQPVPAERQAGK